MTPEQAQALRAPFPDSAIGKLPRAGIQLSYVGHAAVTDRLLEVDPRWSWTPIAFDEVGSPLITQRGPDSVMWIALTVHGVTRYGVGIVASKSFELEKQLISDALRNAAMRFGVALDLWSKEDLSGESSGSEAHPSSRETPSGSEPEVRDSPPLAAAGPSDPPTRPGGPAASFYNPGVASLEKAISRCSALAAIGVDIYQARTKMKLPELRRMRDEADWHHWQQLIANLEAQADREAEQAVKA